MRQLGLHILCSSKEISSTCLVSHLALAMGETEEHILFLQSLPRIAHNYVEIKDKYDLNRYFWSLNTDAMLSLYG